MLKVSANVRYGSRKISADAVGQVALHLLNFKHLVDESVVEPTVAQLKLVVDDGNASAFLSSHKAVYVNISQGMLPPLLLSTLTYYLPNLHYNRKYHLDLIQFHFINLKKNDCIKSNSILNDCIRLKIIALRPIQFKMISLNRIQF